MNEYFGEMGSELFSVYEEATRFAIEAKTNLSPVEYRKAKVVSGLKVRLLDDAIFASKIKAILRKKRNVAFLFTGLSYLHFIIPSIAKELGYRTSNGVACIEAGEVKALRFADTVACYHKNIYELLASPSLNQGTTQDSDRIKEFLAAIDVAQRPDPACACFLADNDEGYYLKPVYPVLQEFRDNDFPAMLFSFSVRTLQQLQTAGYDCSDLSAYVDELEYIMLHDNANIIAEFLRAASASTSNPVLAAYFSCLQNDSVIRGLSRTLGVIAIIDTILEKCKIRSVLVAADGGDPDNDVACEVAANRGVPTFSIPPVITQFIAIFGYLYSASKILISGSRLQQELERLGISPDRIIVTGSPRYDYIIRDQTAGHRPNADEAKGRPLVVVAMSRLHKNDEVWMSVLIGYCNKKGYDIFVKLHPTLQYRNDLKTASDNIVRQISECCKNMRYQISYDEDLRLLLKKAKLLTTDYSSVALEASLHGLSIILFDPDSNSAEDSRAIDFYKEGVAVRALDMKSLCKYVAEMIENDPVAQIKKYLVLNSTKKRLQKARKNFNYQFNYLNDGNASKRIFQLLLGK